MIYTPVAKPVVPTYTYENSQGREQYDQVSLQYDDSGVFYDGINQSLYTYVSKVNASIIDSYSESNQDGSSNLRSVSSAYKVAQTFTVTGSYILDFTKFYLKKVGSPSGKSYSKIYATLAGAPTGDSLAISDAYVVSDLSSSSFTLVTFNFTAANRITLTTGTYAVSFEPDDLTAGTNTLFGTDSSSPGHSGTEYIYNGSTWGVQVPDAIFYVYGGPLTSYTIVAKPT